MQASFRMGVTLHGRASSGRPETTPMAMFQKGQKGWSLHPQSSFTASQKSSEWREVSLLGKGYCMAVETRREIVILNFMDHMHMVPILRTRFVIMNSAYEGS